VELTSNGVHLWLDAGLTTATDTSATVMVCYSFDYGEDHLGGRVITITHQAPLPTVSGVRVQDDWEYCQAPENVKSRFFHQWGWIGPQETYFYTALIEGSDNNLSLCVMVDYKVGKRLIVEGSASTRVEVE
jgi:hypothetical protein